jgi:hypothetical protein
LLQVNLFCSTTAVNSLAYNLANRTASEDDVEGVRAALKKLGPVGRTMYEELKDFAAKVTANVLRPF